MFFDYANGKLSEKPVTEWRDTVPAAEAYWTGLAMHPKEDLLFVGNRAADPGRGHVAVFDTRTGKVVRKIPVDISPYDLQFNESGTLLYVSNWSSDSISVIEVASSKVVATIPTGHNPTIWNSAPTGVCMSRMATKTRSR
jgi:YVTN family beta-propeller protein